MITGKYIKGLRVEAGISQTELARLADISQAHIAKIETEKVNPRLSTVNTCGCWSMIAWWVGQRRIRLE